MHLDNAPFYRPILMVIYGTGITTGAGFLINESPTLARSLDAPWYPIWATLFIFGGVIGLVSVFRRWKPMEAVGLLSLAGAVMVFLVAILFSQPLREQDGVNFGMAGLLSITLLLFSLRAVVLRHQIRIREQKSEEIRHDG